jgi:hypothetical protein
MEKSGKIALGIGVVAIIGGLIWMFSTKKTSNTGSGNTGSGNTGSGNTGSHPPAPAVNTSYYGLASFYGNGREGLTPIRSYPTDNGAIIYSSPSLSLMGYVGNLDFNNAKSVDYVKLINPVDANGGKLSTPAYVRKSNTKIAVQVATVPIPTTPHPHINPNVVVNTGNLTPISNPTLIRTSNFVNLHY